MAPIYQELRTMSDAELIAAHDAGATSTQIGVTYYLDELRRREAQAQGDRMERLTWVIAALTLVSAVAVVLALVITFLHVG